MSEYIQYGCGFSAPRGWRNFDASPTLRFERLPIIGRLYTKNNLRFPDNVEFGDIIRGLPVRDCQAVYCSHILEHLSLTEFRVALRKTNEILLPGGIFRLVLPDLAHSIQRYALNPSNDAALEFMKETSLGQENRSTGLKGLLLTWLGNSSHLWMWDYKSMYQELKKSGFNEIRRAYFGDSIDPMFATVEDPTRWENSLGVECRKLG